MGFGSKEIFRCTRTYVAIRLLITYLSYLGNLALVNHRHGKETRS